MKIRYIYLWLFLLSLIAWISLNMGVAEIHNPISALFGSGSAADISIIREIRAPRILAGILVGAALGIAGALSQGALRNPLAEPVLLGTTGGSAFATLLGILIFEFDLSTPPAIFMGIFGAALATLLTYQIGKRGRDGFSFIITGIAMSALLTALVAITSIMINKPSAQGITFWSLGTLSMATPKQVLTLFPLFVITTIMAVVIAPKLDYLALGDTRAKHLGIDVNKIRLNTFFIVSISIGAVTSIFGQISFLALAIPHIVRGLIGVRHRLLVVHGALLGAMLLTLADLIARTIAHPNELPIGLITALLGAPILITAVRKGLNSDE